MDLLHRGPIGEDSRAIFSSTYKEIILPGEVFILKPRDHFKTPFPDSPPTLETRTVVQEESVLFLPSG
jgi:hypothetical protein